MSRDMMRTLPWDLKIPDDKATLWFLGQAGYYLKSNKSILIDPYLSDSVSKVAPLFGRSYPVPVAPSLIKADIFIATHDHLDHLDPDTIKAYAHKDTTTFVSPRHAGKKLAELGVKNITVIDQGDIAIVEGVRIEGIFALPTSPDVLDTAGYHITFPNGKTVYHTSDTAYCDLLLKACPKADVLLTCINGKYGNLNIPQAIELTRAVNPKYVIPNHYDVMALNSENPESFRFFCQDENIEAKCVILELLDKFIW